MRNIEARVYQSGKERGKNLPWSSSISVEAGWRVPLIQSWISESIIISILSNRRGRREAVIWAHRDTVHKLLICHVCRRSPTSSPIARVRCGWHYGWLGITGMNLKWKEEQENFCRSEAGLVRIAVVVDIARDLAKGPGHWAIGFVDGARGETICLIMGSTERSDHYSEIKSNTWNPTVPQYSSSGFWTWQAW